MFTLNCIYSLLCRPIALFDYWKVVVEITFRCRILYDFLNSYISIQNWFIVHIIWIQKRLYSYINAVSVSLRSVQHRNKSKHSEQCLNKAQLIMANLSYLQYQAHAITDKMNQSWTVAFLQRHDTQRDRLLVCSPRKDFDFRRLTSIYGTTFIKRLMIKRSCYYIRTKYR